MSLASLLNQGVDFVPRRKAQPGRRLLTCVCIGGSCCHQSLSKVWSGPRFVPLTSAQRQTHMYSNTSCILKELSGNDWLGLFTFIWLPSITKMDTCLEAPIQKLTCRQALLACKSKSAARSPRGVARGGTKAPAILMQTVQPDLWSKASLLVNKNKDIIRMTHRRHGPKGQN